MSGCVHRRGNGVLMCPPFGLLIREPHCPPTRSQEAKCSGCLRRLPCRPPASSRQAGCGPKQIICTCVRSARDRGFRGLLKSTRILSSKQISAKPQHENSGQEGWKTETSPRVSQVSPCSEPPNGTSELCESHHDKQRWC